MLEVVIYERLSQKEPLPGIDESRRSLILASRNYHSDALPALNVHGTYQVLMPVNVSFSTRNWLT